MLLSWQTHREIKWDTLCHATCKNSSAISWWRCVTCKIVLSLAAMPSTYILRGWSKRNTWRASVKAGEVDQWQSYANGVIAGFLLWMREKNVPVALIISRRCQMFFPPPICPNLCLTWLEYIIRTTETIQMWDTLVYAHNSVTALSTTPTCARNLILCHVKYLKFI